MIDMTPIISADPMLDTVQREAFLYFDRERNPANGLVKDKSASPWPASITVVGLALTAYPISVLRGYLTRQVAADRTLTTLRFLLSLPQNTDPRSAGMRGFFYHFLDINSGLRDGSCEVSTIDTAFLVAGALTAAEFFNRSEEAEIRALADQLYRRIDWRWAQNRGTLLTHGWRPRRGFIKHRWQGYNEALLLYVLALASPTSPIDPTSYHAWTESYRWETHHGEHYLHSGPLFTHQLSHCWIDFRGIQDVVMRTHEMDYFENSRRATYAQYRYAIANPHGFKGYGAHSWGLNASDGPGPGVRRIGGTRHRFFSYKARGVPFGPDDGTLSPWAAAASLPFAPELVLPLIEHQLEHRPTHLNASYNPSFRQSEDQREWVSPHLYGLDLGPLIVMIENYRTGMIWELMRRSSIIRRGLELASFEGGWL